MLQADLISGSPFWKQGEVKKPLIYPVCVDIVCTSYISLESLDKGLLYKFSFEVQSCISNKK